MPTKFITLAILTSPTQPYSRQGAIPSHPIPFLRTPQIIYTNFTMDHYHPEQNHSMLWNAKTNSGEIQCTLPTPCFSTPTRLECRLQMAPRTYLQSGRQTLVGGDGEGKQPNKLYLPNLTINKRSRPHYTQLHTHVLLNFSIQYENIHCARLTYTPKSS